MACEHAPKGQDRSVQGSALSGSEGIPRCVQLAGCCLSLLEVWNAVERTRLHGNREPGRGATAARGKLEVGDLSDLGPLTAWPSILWEMFSLRIRAIKVSGKSRRMASFKRLQARDLRMEDTAAMAGLLLKRD